MVVADLHVHTTNSDGQLTLSEIPDAARAAGLEAVAVTDHDRVHPDLDEPVTEIDDVEVVSGIELRVAADDMRIDLLGYGVRAHDELRDLEAQLQENRMARARRIVECVEDRLDVSLDVPFEPGVGRPHIARAIDASDAEVSYQDAFDRLIGDDCPCYVAREIPSFERGRKRLADACALVGLAHPLRYPDPERALELVDQLDAVELHYSYGPDVDTAVVERVAREAGVLVTGGSDAHEKELGSTGLDRDEYAAVRSRLD